MGKECGSMVMWARMAGVVAVVLAGTSLVGVPASQAGPVGGARSAAEESSTIVYACWPNLCSVDPVSGVVKQVTTDGRGYEHPSFSADGTRLAAAAWGENAVGAGPAVVAGAYGSNLEETWRVAVRGLQDLAISPDGTQVSTAWWYTELENYLCPGGLCLRVVNRTASDTMSAPGATPAWHRGLTGVGYLGNLLLVTNYAENDPGQVVCTVADPLVDAAPCVLRVHEMSPQVDGQDVIFAQPEGSPDGKYIVATLADIPEAGGAVVDDPVGLNPRVMLYDAVTGARVAQLGSGSSPSFSPDGTQVVYQGTDGMLYVVATSGGAPRVLVAGAQPTWGKALPTSTPPPPPPPPPAAEVKGVGEVVSSKKPLRVKKKRVALTLRCAAAATAGCSGSVVLRAKAPATASKARPGKSVRLAKATRYALGPGTTTTVTVRLSAKGLRLLGQRKVTKTTVLSTATGLKTVRATIKIRR